MSGNATRWYTSREAVKAAAGLAGADLNALIDSYIQSASADIERIVNGRRFIPFLATSYYTPKSGGVSIRPGWADSENPWKYGGLTRALFIDDLLAVTSIKIDMNQNGVFSDETALAAADYLLSPQNAVQQGLPYTTIELTPYGAFVAWPKGSRVEVIGTWGYSQDTAAAGALAALIADAVATSANITNSALIGVGDTLLIDTEALFVSEKALLNTTATLNGALTATQNQTSVPIDLGTKVIVGEVIQVDSERMLVDSIAGNTVTVKRAWDGTVLAAHNNAAAVFAPRTLTIVRGVNGTPAAAHNNAAAISRYVPPTDVTEYCRAYAIAHHQQGRSGWTGQIGGSEGGAVENRMFNIYSMRQGLQEKYGRIGF